jgi:hypothetical protein
MLRLRTVGGLSLTSDGGERPQPRRRLALLARLTPSGDAGVGREELLTDFWPERDADAARHSLDQLLYEMRRALGTSRSARSGGTPSAPCASWCVASRRSSRTTTPAHTRLPGPRLSTQSSRSSDDF